MRALGIRIEFTHQKFPDLLKMGRAGKLQMMRIGWITNYGEGDAFAQLLYSKNIEKMGYNDCGPHAQWYEPIDWHGSPAAKTYPLELISSHPSKRLH